MKEPIQTVEPLDPLSEALGKMKKMDMQELPVVENGKLKGMLTFRTLARRRKIPISAMVKSFMISPPRVRPQDDLSTIVERLVNRDFTSLPVTHRDTIKGVITRREIIKAMVKDNETANIKVETIMNFAPTTIHGDMGVRKAMNMMDLTRENYTAIIDENEVFLGVVDHSSIISFLQQPAHKLHTGDFHGEKVHRDRSISSIAKMPETVDRESNLKDALDLMIRNNVPLIYIMEEGKVVGSIGEVDILELLLRDPTSVGPLVQIAGIEDAKLMDASEINFLINKFIGKIDKFTTVTAVTVRIRHHHHDKDDDKYTVNVKLTTPHTAISREAFDWDLNVAIGNAFVVIEKTLKKEKDKKRNY
ncbi:MAG: CBS domain-containing protein [Candidatus Thermoplasmatota archaeon]|nr:CBS domain-containing protein [Candidatus Thermoplasmatota archaeon]